MKDYLFSGWSFFFRWPVANATTYRPIGIFLGPLLQTLVFLFFSALGFVLLGDELRQWSPMVGFVGLSMLTGFFHEDGLADTADSLGVSKFDSTTSLEKIHSTFKDPRLGTFGVSALVLFWGFRALVVAHGQLSILLLALVCLVARVTSLAFGVLYSKWLQSARSSRSSHVMLSVDARNSVSVLFLVLVFGGAACFALSELAIFHSSHFAVQLSDVSPGNFVFSFVVMLIACSVVFAGLVRRTEALNGDLLGALVCLSEFFITICFLKFL